MDTAKFRNPSLNENKVFEKLLSGCFKGRDSITKQIANCQVRQFDGNGSLEFALSTVTPVADVDSRVPTEGTVCDQDGVAIHLLLHVVNGFIKELEIYREDNRQVIGPIIAESLDVFSP